jgi:uncharacterized membrane protein YkoI
MTLLLRIFLVFCLFGSCYADEATCLARLSLDEATKKILKEGNKRVLGASTEIIDGKEIHIIKVLTPDGHIRHFKIDAETGAVVG